jgi:hypothetical protein
VATVGAATFGELVPLPIGTVGTPFPAPNGTPPLDPAPMPIIFLPF